MSQPVLSIFPVEKVGHIMDILENETFHGFPVIEQDPSVSSPALPPTIQKNIIKLFKFKPST